MANPEHLALLKSGRDAFNAWRDEHPDVQIDLSGADLSKMNLAYYDLDYANLRGADLHGADLRWADLRWADLRWADLRWANLHGANLHGADLRWADLRWANLHGANLHGANLHGADLHGADLRWVDLIFGAQDVRGYQCLLTYDRKTGAVDIQFGYQRWPSFDAARAHFGPGYDSDGDTEEHLLILDQLEARYRLRMKQEADNG